MWKDDEVWYPVFLARKCFRLFLVFDGTETMLGHTLEEVSHPALNKCRFLVPGRKEELK